MERQDAAVDWRGRHYARSQSLLPTVPSASPSPPMSRLPEERVARAARWFPELSALSSPPGRSDVNENEAGSAPWDVDPQWVDHAGGPPGRSVHSLLTDAVAQATARLNERRVLTGEAAVTVAEVLQSPAVDCYPVRSLPDGRPMFATLVNTVYKSPMSGASVYVPWGEADGKRAYAMSAVLMRQRLLGVASATIKTASHARQFCIAYRAPFRGNHHICAERLNIQETAVMSDAMGEFTLQVTLALQAIACGQPQLRVTERRRENCVYVSYMPFRIDIPRLITLVAGCHILPTRFSGVVIRHPELGRRCLNVFPKGVLICVGAKAPDQMAAVFDTFMDAIYGARAPPVGTAVLPAHAPAKKQRAADSDPDGSVAKRARLE